MKSFSGYNTTSSNMGLPEVVEFSRNFAVLVKIHGSDPKGLKMRKHAFHQYHSGNTTLSASGMLLPANLYNTEVAKRMLGGNSDGDLALVLTVASVIEPFLPLRHRTGLSLGRVDLIPGARIEIMVEGQINAEKDAPRWFPAQLMSVVDVPESSAALQSLVEASSGSKDHGWDVGWSLISHNDDSQPSIDVIQTQRHAQGEEFNPSLMAKSATRIAILGISFSFQGQPNITVSSSINRGDSLVAVGSPFGILSPVHFFNSISAGSIANCYPPGSSKKSLLIADVRCLPGMEGSPVFDYHGRLIGVLVRPLRQKSNGAEIQLVIPWEVIPTAYSGFLLKEPRNEGKKGIHIGNTMLSAVSTASLSNSRDSDGVWYETNENHGIISFPPEMPVEKAMASVCLITVNDSVWASGVLLNDLGLVLTNAHLLEPWRFGKASVNGERKRSGSREYLFGGDELPSVANGIKEYRNELFGHRDIRVRLGYLDPWVWCPAKVVYISKGPLDVALLQLHYVPEKLCPIVADYSCPPLGSKAYVIGHGLLGPRSGFSPSVCSGLVAKVVKAKKVSCNQTVLQGEVDFPAMLETTAAVHPGGSGGAVVNSNGHMIGLVTSNARHAGGTVIPHLNFSIPCAVLAPLFQFAGDMRDLKILENLDQPNEELSSVWALMPPLSPKPNPSFPVLPQTILEGNNKEGKGSRFARFIEESREMLGSSSPSQLPNKPEKLSNEIFTSKL